MALSLEPSTNDSKTAQRKFGSGNTAESVQEASAPHAEHIANKNKGGTLRHAAASPNPTPDPDRLEEAADQAIAACVGDAGEAVKALIVANEFLERRLEVLASP